MSESGTAQVPGLQGVPDFNIEEELASATEFVLEPAAPAGKAKSEGKPRTVNRSELLEMIGSSGAGDHSGHEEE